MHNACCAMGGNNVYVAMRPASLARAITGLRGPSVLSAWSVTVPFKVEVMRHLDAIDPVAARIGSVNTLVFQRQQDDSVRCTGHNTDWIGANQALGETLDPAGRTCSCSAPAARPGQWDLACSGRGRNCCSPTEPLPRVGNWPTNWVAPSSPPRTWVR